MGNSGSGFDAIIGVGVEKLKEEIYLLEKEKAYLYSDINLKKELPKLRDERENLIREIEQLKVDVLDRAKVLSSEITRVAQVSTEHIRQANAGAKKNLNDTYNKIKVSNEKFIVAEKKVQDFIEEHARLLLKIEEAHKKYETEKLEHEKNIFTANKKLETKVAKVKAQEADVREASRRSLEQEANVTAYAKDKDELLKSIARALDAKEVEQKSIQEKLDKDLSKLTTKTETDKEASVRIKFLQEREGEKLVHTKNSLDALDSDLTQRATKVRKDEESLKLNQEALLSAKKKFEDEKRRFLSGR